MKAIVLISILFGAIAFPLFSQQIIEYDFSKKEYKIGGTPMTEGDLVLDYNHSYRFRIINIDTRRFGYFGLTPEQRKLMEEEIHGIFSQILAKPTDKSDPAAGDSGIKDKVDKAKNSLDKTDSEIKTNKSKPGGRSLTDAEKKSLEKKRAEEQRKLEILQRYQDLYGRVQDLAAEVTIAYNNIEKFKRLSNELVDLYISDKSNNEQLKASVLGIEGKYSEILAMEGQLIVLFDEADKNFKDGFSQFRSDKIVDSLTLKEPVLAIDQQLLLNRAEILRTQVAAFNKDSGYAKRCEAVKFMITKLNNGVLDTLTFDEEILPIQDQMVITLKYKELDRMLPGVNQSDKQDIVKPVTFNIKGGVRISFSAGLMVQAYLYDRKYSTSPTADSGYSVITLDQNHSLFQPTIGALMHVVFRRAKSVTHGFSWGLGTNVTALSGITIFAGYSLVLGREERFILTAGFATAPVEYLNGKYELDKPVKTSDLTGASITTKAYRPGCFIGFTYNLIKPKTQKKGE